MELSPALAVISLGGFAVQRVLELLDPLLHFLTLGLKKILPQDLTESTIKGWLTALLGFLASIPIALATDIKIVSAGNSQSEWVNVVVGALAIGAGSNGLNSVLKFGELVKEARKGQG